MSGAARAALSRARGVPSEHSSKGDDDEQQRTQDPIDCKA
jgi:hypothetical protein